MYQVTVTIGRNVGDSPMADADWQRFAARVVNRLEWIGADSVERHDGRGEWDGIVEDSSKFSALFDSLDSRSVDALRHSLSIIRDDYQQDAIALCIGNSELI